MANTWENGGGGWVSSGDHGDADTADSYIPADTSGINQSLADYLGFTGSLDGYTTIQHGWNGDADNSETIWETNPEWTALLNNSGLSLKSLATGSGYLQGYFDKAGNNKGGYSYSPWTGDDPLFGALVDIGVGSVLGGAVPGTGGGLAGGLGMGTTGWIPGAINGAATGATIAAGNEGNILQGALAGGVGGGVAGANPAGAMGVTNTALSKGINAATGSFLGGMASGKSAGEAAKSGAMSGLSAGVSNSMNDLYKNIFSMYGSDGGLDSLQGSGGDMSNQTDITQSTYNEDSPAYRYQGDQSAPTTSFLGGPAAGGANPQSDEKQKQLLGLNLPSSGQLGNFLSNNAGTLAQTLYGLYNNRRQQRALGSQMAGLQGLYGQNSPYAQQLRAKLQAQAAQGGKRTNTGARETQLQAALADKAASLAPSLYQMQQGQMGLQNNQMATLLGGYRNLKGLGDLFNQNQFDPLASTYFTGNSGIGD